MPPLPNVANVMRCRLVGANVDAAWNVIFYLQFSGTPPTSATLQTLGASIAAAYLSNLASLANISNSLTEVHLADLTTPTSASATVSVNEVGTRTGTAFTAQVAMVGSWQVNFRRRGGHWRNYWTFGVTSDMLSARHWTPAFTTAAATGLGGFRTALNAMNVGGSPISLVAVSFFNGVNPNPPPKSLLRPVPLVLPITGVAVHPRIDTQRRRLGKET
jgi:hypothetical protein